MTEILISWLIIRTYDLYISPHARYKLNHGSLPTASQLPRKPNKKTTLKTAPKTAFQKRAAKTPCLWCNQTMHWIWYGALGIGPVGHWDLGFAWPTKILPKWWWIISDGIPMVNRIRKKHPRKNKQIQVMRVWNSPFSSSSPSSWYQQRKPKPANEMFFPSFFLVLDFFLQQKHPALLPLFQYTFIFLWKPPWMDPCEHHKWTPGWLSMLVYWNVPNWSKRRQNLHQKSTPTKIYREFP